MITLVYNVIFGFICHVILPSNILLAPCNASLRHLGCSDPPQSARPFNVQPKPQGIGPGMDKLH